METQLRTDPPGRTSYIKRFFIFFLIVSLMIMFIQPKPAKAVDFVVTPIMIAAFLTVASLCGITFYAANDTALRNSISEFLYHFTNGAGMTAAQLQVWWEDAALKMYEIDAKFLQEAVCSYVVAYPATVKTDRYIAFGDFKIPINQTWSSADATWYYLQRTSYSMYASPGNIIPFDWYPEFNITLMQSPTSPDWWRIELYNGVTFISKTGFEKALSEYHFVIYHDGTDIELRDSQGYGVTLTSTPFGQAILAAIASTLPTYRSGTYVENTEIRNMPIGSTMTVPTTLDTPDAVIAASQAQTLPQALGTTTVANPNPETPTSDYKPSQARIQSLGAIFITKFPFCVPWDFKNAVSLLAAPAEAPHWEVDFYAPIAYRVGGWKGSTSIEIDFSDYEGLAALVRWFETIIFCAGLIVGTKRLIWTA